MVLRRRGRRRQVAAGALTPSTRRPSAALPVLAGRAVPGRQPGAVPPADRGASSAAFRAARRRRTTRRSRASRATSAGSCPAWRDGAAGADESPGAARPRRSCGCSPCSAADGGLRARARGPALGRPRDAGRRSTTSPTPCGPSRCCASARAGPTGAADDLLDRLERRDPARGRARRPARRGRRRPDGRAPASATPTPPAGLSDVRARPQRRQPVPRRGAARRPGRRRATLRRDGRPLGRAPAPLTPTVPASLRESIQRRARRPRRRPPAGCSAPPRCSAAASTGSCCPGIAEVDGRAAVDAPPRRGRRAAHRGRRRRLHASATPSPARRCSPTCSRPSGASWPPGRGRRIERANPGLPGPTLRAGRRPGRGGRRAASAAARHLVESARRALAGGALATAEATARRAVGAGRGRRRGARSTPTRCSSRCSSRRASRPRRSRSAGDLADAARAGGAPAERRADLLVATARAAARGRRRRGRRPTDAAPARAGGRRRRPGARSPGSTPSPPSVALDQADLDEAERLAVGRRSSGARPPTSPRCSARRCSCSGRSCAPRTGMDGRASRCSSEAGDGGGGRRAGPLAPAGRSRSWRCVVWTRGDLQPLAATSGTSPPATARSSRSRSMDLDPRRRRARPASTATAASQAATACVDASRRYGLATEPVAHLWLAGAHALAGDDAAMQAAIDAALAPDPDDPRILGDLYGRVLLTARLRATTSSTACPALLDDDDRARPPGAADDVGLPGPDPLGAAAHHRRRRPRRRRPGPSSREAADADRAGRCSTGCGELIEAVALGRPGDARGRRRPVRRRPTTQLAARPLGRGHGRTPRRSLVARAAIRDGWGDPVRWLREAEAFFADRRLRPARPPLPHAARRGRRAGAPPGPGRLRGAAGRCGRWA